MPLKWELKKWLAANHDIYKPSQLQAVLAERAGVYLSLQAISALLNSKPHALRLQTIQALCDSLDCKMSDFCEVYPNPDRARHRQRRKVASESPKRMYGAKNEAVTEGESIYPDPRRFSGSKKHSG
jgi:DNA-binding Xre family transcriptional regulator